MTDCELCAELTECLQHDRGAALATLTAVDGSSPGKEGFMLLVREDGTTCGTVGGGNIEKIVTDLAMKCMARGRSGRYEFNLADGGDAGMQCGGTNEVFIRVFRPKKKLLLVGGGHIGCELYELGRRLDFTVVMFDDRAEYCSKERFPAAAELHPGDIAQNLAQYPLDDQCHVVIATHGHRHDEAALRAVIRREAAYIGMIGSRKKVPGILAKLQGEGVPAEKVRRVYSPIGLKLGGGSPAEIALSVMAEILMVKNHGAMGHMRD